MNKKSDHAYELIFGLTADPIHLGHEQVIIDSIEFLKKKGAQINRFLLVPVYSPHLIANKQLPQAPFRQRFEMCKIVARRLGSRYKTQIEVSNVEMKLAKKTEQPNFSINTIKALKLKNSLFIVSADHFSGRWPKFRKWYNWRQILENTGLLIHQRSGSMINENFIKELKMINSDIFIISSNNQVDTSSTYIREHFNCKDMASYLSQDIIQFIKSGKPY